jgi:hypothetical protein
MSDVVYVAGPYTAKNDFDRLVNIENANKVTAELWAAGYYALCPHKITAFFGGLCPEHVFIEGGLEFLRRSDKVVLIDGWESSNGTMGEIKEAMRLDIPVYEGVSDLINNIEIDYSNAKFYIDIWERRKKIVVH